MENQKGQLVCQNYMPELSPKSQLFPWCKGVDNTKIRGWKSERNWMFLSDIFPTPDSPQFSRLPLPGVCVLRSPFRSLGVTHIASHTLAASGVTSEMRGTGTAAPAPTGSAQESFRHIRSLWKAAAVTEVNLEWPEKAESLNSKLDLYLIFRRLDKLLHLSQ